MRFHVNNTIHTVSSEKHLLDLVLLKILVLRRPRQADHSKLYNEILHHIKEREKRGKGGTHTLTHSCQLLLSLKTASFHKTSQKKDYHELERMESEKRNELKTTSGFHFNVFQNILWEEKLKL